MADSIKRIYELQVKLSQESLASLRKLEGSAKKSEKALNGLQKQAKKLSNSLKAAASAWVAFQVAQSAGAFIRTSDSFTNINSRIRLVTKSTEELNTVYNDLERISLATFSNFESNVSSFQRLKQATDGIGVSTEDLLRVQEGISQTFRISGTDALGAAAATLQLAQALGSGRLAGDEFRSVSEQNVRFLKLLGDSLGVSTGQLKQLAANGKLTTEVIVNALNPALEGLREEASKIDKTVGGGFQNLITSFTSFAGEIDRSIGLTRNLSQALVAMSQALADSAKESRNAEDETSLLVKSQFDWGKTLEQNQVRQNQLNTSIGNFQRLGVTSTKALFKFTSELNQLELKDPFLQLVKAQEDYLTTQERVNDLGRENVGPLILEKLENERRIYKELKVFVEAYAKAKNAAFKKSSESKALSQAAKFAKEYAKGLDESFKANNKFLESIKKPQTELQRLQADLSRVEKIISGSGDPKLAADIQLAADKAEILNKQIDKLEDQQKKDDESNIRSFLAGFDTEQQILDLEALRAELLLLDQVRPEAVKKAVADIDEQISELKTTSKDTASIIEKNMVGWIDSTSDAFVDFAFGAEDAFKNLANSIIKDIARIAAKQAILGKQGADGNFAGGVLSALLNAKGNAFTGPIGSGKSNVIPFAKGGVVSSPTVFPMAQGAGLMGEAGAEAIIPLTRTSNGDLGVKAEGMGGNVVVNIINNTTSDISQTSSTSGGVTTIDVVINQAVSDGIVNGSFDRQLGASFGLNRKGR